MRYYYLMCAIILCSTNGLSQSRGYIVKGDTAFTMGKISFTPKISDIIKFHIGKKKVVEYSADQVSEFGFKDSTKYFSKRITYKGESKNTFVELLESGTINLYRLKSKKDGIYIENDSLLLIDSDNYKVVLKKYSEDYSKWNKQYLLLKPKAKPMSFFVRNYNSNKEVNIPFINFGLLFGYSFSNIELSQDSYSQSEFGIIQMESKSINLGLFMETPIWNTNNFSFLSQLSFFNDEFIKEFLSSSLNQDIKINLSHLKLELAPKYTLNSNFLRPYVLLGGVFDYALNSKSEVFQATIDNTTITFEQKNNVINMPDYYYGLVYGLGFNFFYKYNKYLSVELKNSKMIGAFNTKLNNFSVLLKANL